MWRGGNTAAIVSPYLVCKFRLELFNVLTVENNLTPESNLNGLSNRDLTPPKDNCYHTIDTIAVSVDTSVTRM